MFNAQASELCRSGVEWQLCYPLFVWSLEVDTNICSVCHALPFHTPWPPPHPLWQR